MIEIRKKNNVIPKAWGEELVIENNDLYCGKLLRFNNKAEFSFHYHMEKTETFYVNSGIFILKYFDLNNAEEFMCELIEGDTIHIPNGNPHKLICVSVGGGEIFEVSTPHKDEDSYRIGKGDSQK